LQDEVSTKKVTAPEPASFVKEEKPVVVNKDSTNEITELRKMVETLANEVIALKKRDPNKERYVPNPDNEREIATERKAFLKALGDMKSEENIAMMNEKKINPLTAVMKELDGCKLKLQHNK